MTVQPRPTPLHPPVDSALSLQAYIDRRLVSIESDLGDDEWCQHAGIRGQDRLTAYRTTLLDVAFAIREWVTTEQQELAAMLAVDTEEERWKDTYGPDADKLATYQAEGR
jgi:hypothetical protein